MPPDIDANLTKIKNSAKALNALADRATEQIKKLDAFLVEHNPGIVVVGECILLEKGRNRRKHLVDMYHNIGYDRDEEGRWGLVVECLASRTDEDGALIYETDLTAATGVSPELEVISIRRLTTVARDIRLAAVPSLSKLIAKISQKLEETTKTIEKEIDAVEKISAELKSALKN